MVRNVVPNVEDVSIMMLLPMLRDFVISRKVYDIDLLLHRCLRLRKRFDGRQRVLLENLIHVLLLSPI